MKDYNQMTMDEQYEVIVRNLAECGHRRENFDKETWDCLVDAEGARMALGGPVDTPPSKIPYS